MIKSISFKIHSFAAPSHSEWKKRGREKNICINIANIIHLQIAKWNKHGRVLVDQKKMHSAHRPYSTHMYHKKKCTK